MLLKGCEEIMNREQRRTIIRQMIKANNITHKQAEMAISQDKSLIPLEEGAKVKINVIKIINSKDYKNLSSRYKEFIAKNGKKEFTVEWDKARKEKNSKDKKYFVCLAEDPTQPKWLFWTSDLIILSNPIDFSEKNSYTLEDKVKSAVEEALSRQ